MKAVLFLVLFAIVLSTCLAQFGPPNMGAQQQQSSPNLFQLMMYKNIFDMNWLPLMFLSGQMGGGGGGGAGLLPLFWLRNM